MEFTTEELETVREALYRSGVTGPLLEAVETEIEKRELEFMDFGDPNDCGDACKL
jgi:hypothetical protein